MITGVEIGGGCMYSSAVSINFGEFTWQYRIPDMPE
jgi:hypothetical protein